MNVDAFFPSFERRRILAEVATKEVQASGI